MTDQEFREAIAALPEPPTGSRPPYWDYWRHALWHGGQTDDPANFMNWPVVYHNFLFNHWTNVIDEDYRLLQDDWRRWESVVTLPKTGQPKDNYRGSVFSSALIHQASHLARYERQTGKPVHEMGRILEFGSGFGAMALAAHRAGFHGEYVIYDLPEISLLARYFLDAEGVPARFCQDGQLPDDDFDLLLCMSSISETEPSFRDGFLASVNAESMMFFYQDRFEAWDNADYFKRLDFGLSWKHWNPYVSQPEMWYSLGERK